MSKPTKVKWYSQKRNRATAIHKQRKSCQHYWLAKTYSEFFTDIGTKLNPQVYNLKKIICAKCREERSI